MVLSFLPYNNISKTPLKQGYGFKYQKKWRWLHPKLLQFMVNEQNVPQREAKWVMAPRRTKACSKLLNILSLVKVKYMYKWHGRVLWLCSWPFLKQREWEPGWCLQGRASENAVYPQMRGFYKAQDSENGHILKSSHAVSKSDLSCMLGVFQYIMSAETMKQLGLQNHRNMNWLIECDDWSVTIHTERFKHHF